jgi:hypothetical protein
MIVLFRVPFLLAVLIFLGFVLVEAKPANPCEGKMHSA